MATIEYRKHYMPLESNPEVFTQLIHNLGVTKSLAFVDMFSLEDPDLLDFVPRPVLALILVFPTSPVHEDQRMEEEASFAEYTGSGGGGEQVMWFKQTINNACGLYGILHAVVPDSALADILNACLPLNPADRALALEENEALESAHRAAALLGDSKAPTSAEDEVDFHYVCFIKSHQNGHLYEMDGDRKGPVDKGPLGPDKDLFAGSALDVVKQLIKSEKDGNLNFSLLALVRDD